MALYDTLGTPVVVGGDLQVGSSDGWPFATANDNQTYWDGYATNDQRPDIGAGFGVDYSDRLVDATIHLGDLYVVWVEPQWDGTNRNMHGPYVKQWTGSSWVQLGGEVDPAVTPCAIKVPTSDSNMTSGANISGPNPFDPAVSLGTRGNPANPRLVSDGTDLYCVYSVREVVAANNVPPNGSYVDNAACGCYVPTCDNRQMSRWAARKTYVRKWSGSSWDLYGDLPAATNNGYPNALSLAGSEYRMEAWASSGEPGNVYVGVVEYGPNASVRSWVPSPFCIFGLQLGASAYAQQWYGVRVALFNTGTGTSGTVKTIGTVTSPASTSVPPPFTSVGMEVSGDVPRPVNSSGTPFFFLLVPSLVMVDWATLGIVQTDTFGGANGIGVAYDSSTGKYYLGDPVFEVPADGSGPLVPLDDADYGTSVYVPFNPYPPNQVSLLDRFAPDMGNGNIWAVGGGILNNVTQPPFFLAQYHHNCPAWAAWGHTYGSDALAPAGYTIPAVLGDTLYTVGAYYDPSDSTQDLAIRVYGSTINRNAGQCGAVPTNPFISNRVQIGLAATGSTGTTGVFLHSETQQGSAATGSTGTSGLFVQSEIEAALG